jgi:hypothetical protein
MDLELSDMVSGRQTDWSKFAHSSTLLDAKAGMKGVANKYFWRALVGALHQLDRNFIVCQPTATEEDLANGKKIKPKQPSKIRLLNFGVDSGVGAGYELMKTKIDGKNVYRPKKKKGERINYDKNLTNLMKIVFNTDKLKPTDLHSFIKVLELTNKHTDRKVKQVALDRFLEILFGINGQAQFIEPDPEEDLRLKMGMYNKAVELLHLKPSNKVDEYVKMYMKKVHSLGERFKRHLLNIQPNHAWLNDINEDNYYPENSAEEEKPSENPSKTRETDKKTDKKELNKKKEEKEAKEKEAKEIVKKLVDLSIELDNASTDEEKDAIRKEMEALDKNAQKKNKEAKEYERERKAKDAEDSEDSEDPKKQEKE